MNNDLFERVLIQLQPELAQEFGLAVLEDKKKLKALEIIKEKGLHYLEISLIQGNCSYEEYSMECNRGFVDCKSKTKEEYNLLKEVLKDE